MTRDMRYDKGFFFLGDRAPLSIMATVLYVPLRTVWRWPESRRMCYQPLSASMRERVGNDSTAPMPALAPVIRTVLPGNLDALKMDIAVMVKCKRTVCQIL